MRDIQNHWAKSCIEALIQQGIVSGYPDGTFRPDQPVTRAEFAAMIVKAFRPVPNRSAVRFSDVPTSYWAFGVIQAAYLGSWMTGYPDQRFQPGQVIPRVQAIVALAAGLRLAASGTTEATLTGALADADRIPAYAREKVAAAIEQKLVVNYPDVRRFRADQSATRAEIAAFLCQALAQQSQQQSPVPTALIATTASASTTPPITPPAIPPITPPITSPITEIRGVWLTNIDSEVLFSRQALTIALDRLAQNNFNTVYPTVWNWGYTLYPSAVATRVFGVKQGMYPDVENEGRDEVAEDLQSNRDMLLEIIELARARNLSVIPWFEFGLMAPADSPLALRHPDWLSQRRDRTTIDLQDNGKYSRVWLNPCHPQVQQFLVDLVSELSANYAIDGFQLDDHFGLPVDFGYDATTRSLYQQATGKQPPDNAQDPSWMRWRADQITQLTARLFRAFKTHRPKALFSVSPSPAEFAYSRYLQDWRDWQRRGYIEELLVQIYRRDLASFVSEIDKPEMVSARGQIPTAIGVLSGLRNAPMANDLIKKQVEVTRQRGYAGIVFFFYETIWQAGSGSVAEREARETMVRSLFPTALPRPKPKD
jgi:uncharacterized lipoprotein YddW (UPF0748 family)